MNSFEYTVEKHAQNLLAILEKIPSNPLYIYCPFKMDKVYQNNIVKISDFNEACKICKKFIGLPENSNSWCPCSLLGEELAVKVSWLALENQGYLE